MLFHETSYSCRSMQTASHNYLFIIFLLLKFAKKQSEQRGLNF